MKKPAKKQPAKRVQPGGKLQPAGKQAKTPAGKPHHLTAAQQRGRQQARIRALRHQLQLARHPLPPKKTVKAKKTRKPRALASGELPCVAEALRALGPWLGDEELLAVCPDDPDGTLIGAVLEGAAELGLLASFGPAEPGDTPGLILGLALPEGPHAAVCAGNGLMVSWGRLMPVYGVIEEAWWLEWAAVEHD